MTTALPATSPSLAAARTNNMIAIASGKGGVGKTWLAITLAHALARAGRRTLLFDGDLGLANVDIQLGLMAGHNLGAVLSGRLTLTEVLTRFAEGGFDILAGQSGCGRLANVPVSRLELLSNDLAVLAQDYEHVILDLGAGIDPTVRQLALATGTCIVVTNDEPTALTDAYAFIKLAHQDKTAYQKKLANGEPLTALNRVAANIQVIINMAASRREGETTYAKLLTACQSFLHISPPLLGVVRRDGKVRDAIRCQAPILTRFPNSEAVADVTQIAGRLQALAGPGL